MTQHFHVSTFSMCIYCILHGDTILNQHRHIACIHRVKGENMWAYTPPKAIILMLSILRWYISPTSLWYRLSMFYLCYRMRLWAYYMWGGSTPLPLHPCDPCMKSPNGEMSLVQLYGALEWLFEDILFKNNFFLEDWLICAHKQLLTRICYIVLFPNSRCWATWGLWPKDDDMLLIAGTCFSIASEGALCLYMTVFWCTCECWALSLSKVGEDGEGICS